ncbi:MAG: hypothetical protein J2P56_10145, partial [Verrucomicrobia bacterium]|nr:hypothetical protein [Verrucomicrobiota bacterium]
MGLSLLTLDVSAVRFSPSQSFAILAGFCPLLTLTGYIYGVRIFREPLSPFISQAVSTAFTFLILTAGIFFARPSAPLSQLFVSREPRGVMARRLFPLAVLLTLILGWLCVLGERHNVFGDAFGTALLAITLSALFIVVVSWTVWTVSKLELERAANVKKRAALELQLQREEMAHYNRVLLIGEMTASIVHELNQPLTAISINTSAARRLIEHGKAGPSLVETLSDIAADARRAGEVIQNVRSLVHKGEGIRMPLNLNSVIIDSVRITKQDVIS